MNNIILIGFMGSGKTTLGKLLADELNYTFVDSDQYIESMEKKAIPEIFKEDGELYFRKKEKEFLLHAKLLNKSVISAGGGLPCVGDNMDQLNDLGMTIWLDVDELVLVERVKQDLKFRPKLLGYPTLEEAVHSQLTIRREFYEQAKLQMKNPTPENLLEIIKSPGNS
jgi:shikimate kinase